MANGQEKLKEGWHLDKRVPLTLIMTILLQTGAALWWASAVNERLDAAIDTNQLQNQKIIALQDRVSDNDVENARILERLDGLVITVNNFQSELSETNNLLRGFVNGKR